MATRGGQRGFLSRFLPTTGAAQFFDLFEEHARRTRDAAAFLAAMVCEGADAEAQAEHIKEVEHQGDDITHTVMERLHQTFITPMDRDDMYELISRLDDVLDLIDASSQRIWLYGIRTMEPEARALVDVLVRAVDEVGEAVRGLRNLGDRDRLIAHCTEINRLENEGDQILRRAVARLFQENSDAVQVIKWKEIYENLENAIDRCEDVANVIEGVALEYA